MNVNTLFTLYAHKTDTSIGTGLQELDTFSIHHYNGESNTRCENSMLLV